MSDLYAQALFMLNAVWRRRWAALGAAWLVAIVGWAMVVSKPNTYTSSARIFVDTASILQPLLQGLAVDQDVDVEFEVMKQTLTTRANLEKVARMTDLDLLATTPVEMQRLLDMLKSRTTVRTDGRYLLSIHYRDTDPTRARDVAQALTDVFIEANLGDSRAEIEDAEAFLDRQIAYYEQELEQSEDRLARFKLERLSALPSQENYQFQVEQLRSELAAAEAELQRAQSRQATLRRELDAGPASDTALAIFEAEQALQELLTVYTERHPDVVALKRKLASLRPGAEDPLNPSAAPARPRTPLVDYDQVKLQLSETDAEVAVYAGRSERLRARLERLEQLAAQIPAVEAEHAKLTRDYDVLKTKHAELLARREQAKLSRERDAGGEQIQYQVVDPPRAPAIPDGPSRSFLISAVLLIAAAAGAGFALVLVHVNESFSDPGQLRRAFDLPVFGTVSAVHSLERYRWQVAELSSFAGGCALLVAVYGMMMLTESSVGWAQLVPSAAAAPLYDGLRLVSRLMGA